MLIKRIYGNNIYMEKFTLILGLLGRHMPFLGKLNGPIKYIVIQIIGLLIQKITGIKDMEKSHDKVLDDQILMENLVNEVVVLDDSISSKIFDLSKREKPHWLIVESWIILVVAIILIFFLIYFLIHSNLNKMTRILLSFFLFSLIMIIKNVINYRFVQNSKNNNVMEVILLKTLLNLYHIK